MILDPKLFRKILETFKDSDETFIGIEDIRRGYHEDGIVVVRHLYLLEDREFIERIPGNEYRMKWAGYVYLSHLAETEADDD